MNTTEQIKKYVLARVESLTNAVHYQYGYHTKENILSGLLEMAALSDSFGLPDIHDRITNKIETLQGCKTSAEFLMSL